MNKEDRKLWEEALGIIDDNLGVQDGIITNRFATATKIVEFAKQQVKKLALTDVGNCPNLTEVWNEAVAKREREEITLSESNKCWGALRTLEKYELCKINQY